MSKNEENTKTLEEILEEIREPLKIWWENLCEQEGRIVGRDFVWPELKRLREKENPTKSEKKTIKELEKVTLVHVRILINEFKGNFKRDLKLKDVDREEFFQLFKTEKSLKDAARRLRTTEECVKNIIGELKEEDLIFLEPKKDSFLFYPEPPQKYRDIMFIIPSVSHVLSMLIGSDFHYNDANCNEDAVEELYSWGIEEGCHFALNAGDVNTGEGVYKGQEFSLIRTGATKQADHIIKTFPKRTNLKGKPFKTILIGGNHDASHYNAIGFDILKYICKYREDIIQLGYYEANVQVNGLKIKLVHPMGGVAYAECFDDKTEILTQEEGWIPFEKLTKSHNVATMTKEAHEFQWQKPNLITKQEYNGNLIHFKSRTVDFLVTPEHGMWTRRNPSLKNQKENLEYPTKSHRTINYEWHRETAQNLLDTHRRQKWQLTNCCSEWKGITPPDYIEVPYVQPKKFSNGNMKHIGKIKFSDYCELVAWFVTEGWTDGKRICICQSERVNPENHKQIRDLLDRMGLKYAVSGKDNKNIDINNKELSLFLISKCSNGSENKYLPEDVKNLEAKYLRILFDTMIKGDGWIYKTQDMDSYGYRSISKKLRDDFSEIAIKLGYAISINEDTVSVIGQQKTPSINSKPELVPYDGFVYCCKVDNGLILVKRNGKVTWSHNSYKPQKFIDQLVHGDPMNPDIIFFGHWHRTVSSHYSGIRYLCCGSTQERNDLAKRLNLSGVVCGHIIEIPIDKDGFAVKNEINIRWKDFGLKEVKYIEIEKMEL